MTRHQSQARREAYNLAERKRQARTTERRQERAVKVRARQTTNINR
jgi:hypothetical protein